MLDHLKTNVPSKREIAALKNKVESQSEMIIYVLHWIDRSNRTERMSVYVVSGLVGGVRVRLRSRS